MNTCRHCGGEYDRRYRDETHRHDEALDYDDGRCMACLGRQVLIAGVSTLEQLPTHEVIEKGINAVGQPYVRVRYWDRSEDLIDPMPWDEPASGTYGDSLT